MITISRHIVEEMIKHAKEEYPWECCGMLAGKNQTVTKLFKTKNIAESKDLYELDPLDQVRAFEEIDRLNLQLLGVYHSHPDHPCYPSGLDTSQAFYPNTVFFIISLLEFDNPKIKAFKMLKGREVVEEEIIFD